MISFWIRETFVSIRKALASFILSVISATIAVTLVLASILIIYLTEKFDKTIKEEMTLNLFVSENVSEKDLLRVSDELKSKNYIRIYKYKSKEEAAKDFIAETGEDFTKIIEYNPLPASFEVFLIESFVQKDSINKIISDLKIIPGVEEIYFSADLYYRIVEYLNKSKNYVIGVTCLLLFISIYLVYSTNRLILHQRYDELNTMKLIGANLISIKMPVILASIVIGFLAGLLSLIALLLTDKYISAFPFIPSDLKIILFVSAMFFGPFLGTITSYISIRGISLKI